MTIPTWRTPIDEPLPGADPEAEIQEAVARRGPGRLTVVLAGLAVLAVGVLAGVLLRGAFGSGTTQATAGAGGNAGAARSGLPQGGFGGESGTASGGSGAGGAGGDATSGTVTALADGGFTMTTDDGATVTVTVAADTSVTLQATGATAGTLAAGDTVTVQGTTSDGAIAATRVVEGTLGGGFGGGAPPTQ